MGLPTSGKEAVFRENGDGVDEEDDYCFTMLDFED
jgi:hypothetical protein